MPSLQLIVCMHAAHLLLELGMHIVGVAGGFQKRLDYVMSDGSHLRERVTVSFLLQLIPKLLRLCVEVCMVGVAVVECILQYCGRFRIQNDANNSTHTYDPDKEIFK